MKQILILCLLSAVAMTAVVWRAAAKPNRFGTFSDAQKVQVADVIAAPASFLGKNIEVEGTVSEQCKTMGCYFFMPGANGKLRVELQEIAMNAPTREGHQARVEGQLEPYDSGYQLFASAIEFK